MLAPLLFLTLGSAQPIPPLLVSMPWEASLVVKCGARLGTAFHIGDGRYLTAAHVAEGGECLIQGAKAVTVHKDGTLDVAELSGPPSVAKFEIDCRGFRVNRHYLATGFAGFMRLNLPMIYSAFERDTNGNGMFVGPDSHPGMSGGPLIGEDYRVVGIVLQRWPSRARALSDTHVCAKGKPA